MSLTPRFLAWMPHQRMVPYATSASQRNFKRLEGAVP